MDGAIDSDRRQEARMQATATWELPAGWVRISSQTWGPFVIRELVRRPDGEVVEFTARRHLLVRTTPRAQANRINQ